ncbi:hypothetical protein HOLleu_18234 [Holothuria leucospilota]|uniref:Protein FAM227B n=1 Tax=Holothuria leucospilota TaxID=206669 RepID=A0A9Q1H8Y6_HOLLE|nr:hypothetical protein HOLleu_18234 [Holothuria leucospilota]
MQVQHFYGISQAHTLKYWVTSFFLCTLKLYQFRGFDEKRLTPLPEVDSALTILERVTAAQTSLDRKPHYKEEFKRLFHSKMSEAVLVDSFWWFFLNRFHPSKMVQPKLFNRIAHNYVKLLLSAKHPKYRDVFFQTYADKLAQGMYATFCAAFPDSWRQFQGDFIANICDLTSLWVVGTKPAPGSWQKWNFEKLEPKDLRKEEIMKQDSKKGNLLNLDFSASDVIQSNDGMSSQAPSEFGLSQKGSKLDRRAKVVSPSNASISSSAMKDHLTTSQQDVDHGSIDIVAQAQSSGSDVFSEKEKKVAKGTSLQPIQEQDFEDAQTPSSSPVRHPKLPNRATEKKSKGSKPGGVTPSGGNSYNKGVPPKSALKSASVDTRVSQTSLPHKSTSSVGISESRKMKESHPATEGPTFSKCVFNVSGQSPLVKHFLQKKGLEKKAGIDFFLQRTEIDKLPPYPLQITNFFQGRRRENSLMARPREVKRLSDLLVLELLKDPDEVNTGAAQAVEEALLQQDRESP